MPAWPRKRASNAIIERGLLKVLDRSQTHVRRRPAFAIYRVIGTSSEDGRTYRTEIIGGNWTLRFYLFGAFRTTSMSCMIELRDRNDFGTPP
jgi:hypothetical protein